MASNLPPVKLENFEGPFDLLLELARKRTLDLSRISLRTLTDDFLGYLQTQSIPASVQGDFLVVASTLLLLKVRRLLPDLSPEEEEEVSDLESRVRLYNVYREQARDLQSRWGTLSLLPARHYAEGVERSENSAPLLLECQDLAAAMQRAAARIPPAPHPGAHLRRRGRSLAECLSLFEERLQLAGKFVFQEAVQGVGRQEAAVSFLAILEMARKGQAQLQQKTAFDSLEIHISKL